MPERLGNNRSGKEIVPNEGCLCGDAAVCLEGAQVSKVERYVVLKKGGAEPRLRKASELGTLLCARGQLLGPPRVL